ncbi:putative endonuclease [Tenacibaculum skagerrakense]|uniref:Putative endonuclease n=1 Tax=Tenacibaculum skagerrakense TaxID=186571 RepID=A0A4R2NT55_9FLAO|nr:GIY-YIG nuclease family protein [Tenacibaculum skagerrakense]TCP24664.1 putative endonuclease [Tenacibaculum skagerrakense]
MKKSYVYFITNKNNSVIYIGVTTNLKKRVYEHKTKTRKGFTSKYNCEKLVYFEEYNSIKEAIIREKQLKAGNRKRKEQLINTLNPDWLDLAVDWVFNIN